MKNNIQDIGVRLRKEFIQSMKGRVSGVTRIVGTVHYSGADRLCPGGGNRRVKPSQNLCLSRVLPDKEELTRQTGLDMSRLSPRKAMFVKERLIML